MGILIKNRKLERDLKDWQTYLQSKTGSKVPMTKAVEFAFENRFWESFKNERVWKKRKRKKEYVFRL